MDILDDIKSTLAIIREDLRHKEQRVQVYKKDNNTPAQTALEAEIKGIKGVLDDLEPVIYG